MKIQSSLIPILILTLFSCDFSKSAKIDLTTGLSSKGDGLSSSDVYLSIDDKKISRTTYVYGETFYVNFRNVSGFKKVGKNVFPGMEISVVATNGDTAMYYDDMYADKTEGVDITPLFLYTNITVAKPMSSNNKYKLYVKIWDKKGKGTFKTQMDFDVIHNDNIKVESSDSITYNDIYLFSREESTITDNTIKFNQTYYLIFEGLEGFSADNGKMSVGLSLKATTADGKLLLEEQDLLGEGEFEPALIKEQISANIIFNDNKIKTPVDCEFVVYDKKGDAKVAANVSLEVK
ncbi:MAG: hypothetical protein P1U41_02320 [Vicingaceae bacterium]|nr:hypothetical protein [Vicingaceae bacterium]